MLVGTVCTGLLTLPRAAQAADPAALDGGVSRIDADEATCAPGHTEGDPACKQLKNDRSVMTWFDATDTPLVARFGYPCGWRTSTSEQEEHDQVNVTRSEVGPENAYVDVQVRQHRERVDPGHLDAVAEEGSYDEVEYRYDGAVRTGLVSTADTAQYGTVAHATVPDPDSESLAHLELVSTLKGADCPQPRPDYLLVKRMLASLEPNETIPLVRMSDQDLKGGQLLTVDSVSLPEPGYVAIYETPLPEGVPGSNIIGASSLLAAGSHESITVPLDEALEGTQEVIAVIHRDEGDQIFNYRASSDEDLPYPGPLGAPISDAATVTVITRTTTTRKQTTTTEQAATRTTATPTSSPAQARGVTTTSPPADGATTTEADADGFGFGASLAAFVAASVMWIRRQHDGSDE